VKRDIALFSGQWADLDIAEVVEKAHGWGYDGLELASWGRHLDLEKALSDTSYRSEIRRIFDRFGMKIDAISNHLVGQAVSDHYIDKRHQRMLPPAIWGDGDADGIRARATESMKTAARVAAQLEVPVVSGFSGSPIWHMIAGWPPITPEDVSDGYALFADQWNPIIDVFEAEGVKFALEVHPSEIAFDYWTTQSTLDAMAWRPGFGINFDPGHLFWQQIDLVGYIDDFGSRIYHCHGKEASLHLNGRNGLISGLLEFGNLKRGWDFSSIGHGDVSWDHLIRALNAVGYAGAISVEWDDAHIGREQAVEEAVQLLRGYSVERTGGAFQDVFK
jgi:Sugar phosphate isomerases/epimerases